MSHSAGNFPQADLRTKAIQTLRALAFTIGANTGNFFGGQYGLILRRPLYFFNHHHIDGRLCRF